MKMSRTLAPLAAIAALAMLALASTAAAAITESQVTTPGSPTFGIYDQDAPQGIDVAGTTDSTEPASDEVNLDCYNGSGPGFEFANLTQNVELASDGSFSASGLEPEEITDRVCRLLAVPSGPPPAENELEPFSGPVLGLSEIKSEKISGGPNDGQAYDFYAWGQQLTAANDYESISGCGLTDGFLFDAALNQTTTTFWCNDYFYSANGSDSSPATRSQIQVDGANGYLADTAKQISENATGLPAVSFSYDFDPSNGDLTIHDSEPVVMCPEATYPPSSASCPSFEPTGVRIDRTIVQNHDGHLVTFSDDYVSTDGKAHSVDIEAENDQNFGFSGEEVAYRFPGESAYSAHAEDESLPIAATSPAATYIEVEGSPDGDHETGRGAIIWEHAPSSAHFNHVNGAYSGMSLAQDLAVPAGGSTSNSVAYAQSYDQAEVETLAHAAEAAFRPHEEEAQPVVVPPPPPPPAAAKPSNAFKFGKVKLASNGTAHISVVVPGAGKLSLSGKKVKSKAAGAAAAGTVTVVVKPKPALAKQLKKRGKAKVSVKLAFTPTGGDTAVQSKSITLRRKS